MQIYNFDLISEVGVVGKQIDEIYSIYASDQLWQSVDAFVCSYPAATCELFDKFNKSVIIWTTGRYDFRRETKSQWMQWNKRIEAMAANENNVIAANNIYDQHYMR